MNWTAFDFVVAGVLFGGTAGLIALVMLLTRNAAYRAATVLAVLASLLLFWSNGAVGIVGDPGNEANLMYYAALFVPLTGALIAQFRARGMAGAMFTTAAVLASIGVSVLLLRLGTDAQNWILGIAIGSGAFGAMFAGSGWLFLQAAKTSAQPA